MSHAELTSHLTRIVHKQGIPAEMMTISFKQFIKNKVAQDNKDRTKQQKWGYGHLEPTFHGAFYKHVPGRSHIMDRKETHKFICFLKVAVAQVYQKQCAPIHAV